MLLAMMLGMFAGAAIFVAASDSTAQDAIKGHAIAWVSVMALSMTAPMMGWMHYRGHAWSVCLEMAAVMIAPAIPLCLLRTGDVVSGSVCGAYCGLSLLAMVGVVVYRRGYYSHDPVNAEA